MYKNSVLIVEDQYIMAHVMVQKLTQLGFIMAHAHTGESAIEKLKDKAFYFILMDIELGKGINGIVTTQKIRILEQKTGRPHTPIIALANDLTDEKKAYYLEKSFDDAINKPLTDDRCHHVISVARKMWSSNNLPHINHNNSL